MIIDPRAAVLSAAVINTYTAAMRGLLRKMTVTLTDPVGYGLHFVDQPDFALNPFVGQRLTIKWHGSIECQHSGRKTKKYPIQ